MEQYRKKPVVIEAIKFAKDNLIEVISFVEQKDKHTIVKSALAGGDRYLDWEESVIKGGFKIKTLEGEMTASVGDWIIKGIKGEFYPCKPDIFEATYEPATPAKAEQPFNRDENSVEGKAAIEFYEWLQRSSMAKAEVPINIKWRMFVDQKNVKQKNNQ